MNLSPPANTNTNQCRKYPQTNRKRTSNAAEILARQCVSVLAKHLIDNNPTYKTRHMISFHMVQFTIDGGDINEICCQLHQHPPALCLILQALSVCEARVPVCVNLEVPKQVQLCRLAQQLLHCI